MECSSSGHQYMECSSSGVTNVWSVLRRGHQYVECSSSGSPIYGVFFVGVTNIWRVLRRMSPICGGSCGLIWCVDQRLERSFAVRENGELNVLYG